MFACMRSEDIKHDWEVISSGDGEMTAHCTAGEMGHSADGPDVRLTCATAAKPSTTPPSRSVRRMSLPTEATSNNIPIRLGHPFPCRRCVQRRYVRPPSYISQFGDTDCACCRETEDTRSSNMMPQGTPTRATHEHSPKRQQGPSHPAHRAKEPKYWESSTRARAVIRVRFER